MKTILRLNTDIFKNMLLGILVIGLLFFTGCKTSKTSADPRDFEELREIVNKRELTIKFQWAQPQRGGMIDLMSNPNEITVSGDQVAIYLPYFGVRHRGGVYSNNGGGIKYEGPISDFLVIEDPSKRNIRIEFEAIEDTENLKFRITLYENGTAHASVFSSDRDNIEYQGGDVTPTSRLSEN